MTVIAAFAVRGYPVVFGDLLITGETSQDHTFAVPSRGDVSDFFGDSGWKILGLRQKVVLISEEVAVAWAGHWLGARVVIEELRRRAQCEVLTAESILEYLDGEPELARYPAAFVGCVSRGGASQTFGSNGSEAFESKQLGTVYLAGSGARALRDTFGMLDRASHAMDGDVSASDEAVVHGLIFGGLLLQSEVYWRESATPLAHMFGGGYEIASLVDGVLQKLPEVTYVFWQGTLDASGSDVEPLLFVRQTYWRDHLMLRSCRITGLMGDDNVVPAEHQHHVIGPMYSVSYGNADAPPIPISLESRRVAHFIVVYREKKFVGIVGRLRMYGDSEQLTMRFEDHDGKVRIGLHPDELKLITEAVEAHRVGTREGVAKAAARKSL